GLTRTRGVGPAYIRTLERAETPKGIGSLARLPRLAPDIDLFSGRTLSRAYALGSRNCPARPDIDLLSGGRLRARAAPQCTALASLSWLCPRLRGKQGALERIGWGTLFLALRRKVCAYFS